jgi:hypothetical protein
MRTRDGDKINRVAELDPVAQDVTKQAEVTTFTKGESCGLTYAEARQGSRYPSVISSLRSLEIPLLLRERGVHRDRGEDPIQERL